MVLPSRKAQRRNGTQRLPLLSVSDPVVFGPFRRDPNITEYSSFLIGNRPHVVSVYRRLSA